MKRVVWILPVVILLAGILVIAEDSKSDVKAMKQQLTKKIEAMKANGASQEEINQLIADFKKKVAAMEPGQKTELDQVDALKVAAKKKIAEMKAAGASEAEINEVTAKYKEKIKQLEVKMLQEEKLKAKAKSEDETKAKAKTKAKEKGKTE
jgi:cytochrome c-type biogenesis protein CcmH/NrfF